MLAGFAHVATVESSINPEVQAVGRARLAVVERALTRLPAAKRAVFVMIELEGLSHEEVARALDLPLPTVRTRLFHAKRALLVALEGAGA